MDIGYARFAWLCHRAAGLDGCLGAVEEKRLGPVIVGLGRLKRSQLAGLYLWSQWAGLRRATPSEGHEIESAEEYFKQVAGMRPMQGLVLGRRPLGCRTEARVRTLTVATGVALDGRDLQRCKAPKACQRSEPNPQGTTLPPTAPCIRGMATGAPSKNGDGCAWSSKMGARERDDQDEEQVRKLTTLLAEADDGMLVATDGWRMHGGALRGPWLWATRLSASSRARRELQLLENGQLS